MPSDNDPLLGEIRSSFGGVVYTHKTHEKQAEICAKRGTTMKTVNVGVFGVTLIATLIAPLLNNDLVAWLAACSAALGFMFSFVQLSYDPAGDSAKHRAAAKQFLTLRNAYSRLITDAVSGASTAELRARRDALAERLDVLTGTAPQTSNKAYKMAEAALNHDEGLMLSPEEEARLLPAEARARLQENQRNGA